MTSPALFNYESNVSILTSDNYSLKIKALIDHTNNLDDRIQSVVNTVSKGFFKNLTLFEALNLIENSDNDVFRNYHKSLVNEGNNNEVHLTKITLTTVEAIQAENETEKIKFALDPKLEGRKKKRGLMGKLFGKK